MLADIVIDRLSFVFTQELLCQYRTLIMKLQDDIQMSGGGRSLGTGETPGRAQELKDQMTQLTQENVSWTCKIAEHFCLSVEKHKLKWSQGLIRQEENPVMILMMGMLVLNDNPSD